MTLYCFTLLPLLFGLCIGEGSRDLFPTDYRCREFDLEGVCRANLEWSSDFYGFRTGTYRRTLLYVYVRAGEVLLMGSSAVGQSLGDAVVYPPRAVQGRGGNEMFPSPPTFSCKNDQPGKGRILSRAQEKVGPQDIPKLSQSLQAGYDPCYWVAETTGIHNVAFYGPLGETPLFVNAHADGNISDVPIGIEQGSSVAAWDVTVRSGINSVTNIIGRVFTYTLSVSTGANQRPLHIDLYAITQDGYLYRVSTAGIDGDSWPIYGSSKGFIDTDEKTPLYHDVRIQQNIPVDGAIPLFAIPDIPHFINHPTDDILAALGVSSTPVYADILNFYFENSSDGVIYGMGTNLVIVCNSSFAAFDILIRSTTLEITRSLYGQTAGTETLIYWDGKDDQGYFFPAGDIVTATVRLHFGEYHFIMVDIEANVGGGPRIERLNGPCPALVGGCFAGFFNDEGYRLHSGEIIGTVHGNLCPDGSAVGPGKSDPINGYDTRTTQRAFGLSNGVTETGTDCGSVDSFGDAKGLDTWTYTPSRALSASISISPPIASEPAFVSTWLTKTDGENITLPLSHPGLLIQIDWGDNSTVANVSTSTTVSHSYAVAGMYVIKIFGTLPGFQFRGSNDAKKLIKINAWGGFVIDETSLGSFLGCVNLIDIDARDQPQVLTGAVLDYFFMNCHALNPSRLHWDLSNAVRLRGMFLSAWKFNAFVDFTLRDAVDLSQMFQGCQNFNQSIELNTTNVISMAYMFSSATSFNSPIALRPTNKVHSMKGMFEGATAFNQPVFFYTESVQDMSFMFANAISFNQHISYDTGNCIDMAGMFSNARSFNRVFSIRTNNVTNMSQMFKDAISFNQQVEFSAANVEDMSEMFFGATSFNQLIIFNKYPTKGLNMREMFRGATNYNQALILVPVAVTKIDGMFRDAISFNSLVKFNTSLVQNMSQLFANATSFDRFVTFDTSEVVDMSSMFENIAVYSQPLLFNTSKVQNMTKMFSNTLLLSTSWLSAFDTSSVFDVSQMFYNTTVNGPFATKWQTNNIQSCDNFCRYCGLPTFQLCSPCPALIFQSGYGYDVCNCQPGRPIASPTLCVSVPCVPPGYSRLPSGACVCAPGYNGTVKFNGTTTFGCELASSCDGEGAMGEPGNCSCRKGYYQRNQTTGAKANFVECVLADCPSPAFWRVGGVCACAPGYEGTPLYDGRSVSGCVGVQNESAVIVPFTNTSHELVVNATHGVTVILPPDAEYGGEGTVIVKTSNQTGTTESIIVTIDFFDSFGNPKAINNLSFPFRFTIPLIPGASDAVSMCEGLEPVLLLPKCRWQDGVTGEWNSAGCSTVNLTSTTVECSCVHMTDFALALPNYNRVPIQQILSLTPANVRKNPDGLMTVSLVLVLFALLLGISAYRDVTELRRSSAASLTKWSTEVATLFQTNNMTLFARFKLGLQEYHTWAALLCRKAGTSFRSTDRVFVTLMMVLTLMSMSANFHRRIQTYMGRTFVIGSSVLASLVPSQILSFLFRHTGEMGFLEKWQLDQGFSQPSRFDCLNHRFSARWRWVWCGLVLVCAVLLILYILSIALMFDQNPWYYCRGQTTQAWIIDFVAQYALTVFVVEPLKIFIIVLLKSYKRQKPQRRLSGSFALEAIHYRPLDPPVR